MVAGTLSLIHFCQSWILWCFRPFQHGNEMVIMSLLNVREKKEGRTAPAGLTPLQKPNGVVAISNSKELSGNIPHGSALHFIIGEEGVGVTFLISNSCISWLSLVIPSLSPSFISFPFLSIVFRVKVNFYLSTKLSLPRDF